MFNIEHMYRALDLAKKGLGKTAPNPMVGAVIVAKDKVISEGWHRYCGGAHAEVNAIKKAQKKLKGADLYVTLEPCHHYGRTPPCVDQVIQHGLKNVFIGMKDPNPLTSGKSIAKLRRAGIKVKVGILSEEIAQMNEAYNKFITKKMPFVTAKCAQTLDGKIGTVTGQSKWITSQASRDFAHGLRDQFDAILVGINTVLKDNPRLNGIRKTKRMKKIVLDSSLKISPKANLFKNTLPADCILATTSKASSTKIKSFQKKGVCVIVCPQKGRHVDITWLFKELGSLGVTNLLIEGGAKVIGRALKRNLVDKMHIYVAPKILGDQAAISSVQGFKAKDVNKSLQLKDLQVNPIGEDLFITGYVHRNC